MTAGRWQIPQSWQWVEMQEISEVVGGGTPNASDTSNFDPDGTPWLTPADLSGYRETYISRGSRNLSAKGMAACGAKVMPEGAVLFTSRAPVGYVAIAANPIATNQGFKSFVLATDCVPEFFRYYLKSSKAYAESMASGSTFLELSGGRAKELAAPLAPKNEQRRIVAKLDDLFEKSRSIRGKLDRLPRLLANLQKSILNSAFRGDLTKEWRANTPNVEPASELLKRIRAERRAKWESDLIAKGKDPKKAKYVEPEPVDTEELPELPKGWCWASGAELFIWGSGDFLPKSQQEDGDFPVYGGNGIAGSHSSANVDHIALVIGRVGANCGNAHLTGGAAWITDNAIFSKWSAPSLNLGFAQTFLSLHDIRSQAQGGGQPFVSQGTLNSIAIPVPPLSEQEEILFSASASMDRLSGLCGLINTAQEKITNYEASSLAKAFRGELVPQDPNDEPASVLLERIRAQKPAVGTKRGRGKKAAEKVEEPTAV